MSVTNISSWTRIFIPIEFTSLSRPPGAYLSRLASSLPFPFLQALSPPTPPDVDAAASPRRRETPWGRPLFDPTLSSLSPTHHRFTLLLLPNPRRRARSRYGDARSRRRRWWAEPVVSWRWWPWCRRMTTTADSDRCWRRAPSACVWPWNPRVPPQQVVGSPSCAASPLEGKWFLLFSLIFLFSISLGCERSSIRSLNHVKCLGPHWICVLLWLF
jgi:hypothetical protein